MDSFLLPREKMGLKGEGLRLRSWLKQSLLARCLGAMAMIPTVPAQAVLTPKPAPSAQAAPGYGAPKYGVAALGTALLVRGRASKVTRGNYGGFQPVVCDRDDYANDCGYLPDGTPINQAGNKSLRRQKAEAAPVAVAKAKQMPSKLLQTDLYAALQFQTTKKSSVKGAWASESVPTSALVTPVPTEAVAASTTELPKPAAEPVEQALHGTKFGYSLQKDAYADLEFINDVGFLDNGEWIVCCREFSW